MAIHDLSGYFSFRLTAEDVVNGKPDPEIYETAARRFDVATQQMMVLEDSQNGCRAAVAARTVSVAVPGAHSRHHDFSGAVLRADGLTDRRVYQLLRR
jgi:beta-phosphoglucomutase-like phosphatase (HAD superfamily)